MTLVCREITEWIEEEIVKPIEEWVEKTERRCKKFKWYDPRGWFCWLVTLFVKVVPWIVEKVGKWVVRTVCEVISSEVKVIGGIVRGIFNIVVTTAMASSAERSC